MCMSNYGGIKHNVRICSNVVLSICVLAESDERLFVDVFQQGTPLFCLRHLSIDKDTEALRMVCYERRMDHEKFLVRPNEELEGGRSEDTVVIDPISFLLIS